MSSTQTIASVTERVRPVLAGAPVVAAHVLQQTVVFVLGEETLLFVEADGTERRVAVHAGGIMSSAADGTRIAGK